MMIWWVSDQYLHSSRESTVYNKRLSALWFVYLRSPGDSTVMFRYNLLGGDTATPSGLYARFCHAFLVTRQTRVTSNEYNSCYTKFHQILRRRNNVPRSVWNRSGSGKLQGRWPSSPGPSSAAGFRSSSSPWSARSAPNDAWKSRRS